MNNKIFIYLDNDIEEVTYDFSFKVDEYADITIDTNKDKNISAYLKMNKNFIEFLKDHLKGIKKDKDYYSTIVKKTITHILDGNSPFKKLEYIYISYNDINDVPIFLNNNPILRKKKIVLTDYFALDINIAKKLQMIFKDYDNVYINIMGNSEPIIINEYIDTINFIEEYTSKIKKYDLSPFEQIIYAYDLTRNRYFKREDSKEKRSVSRDLTSVLTGDKIVCLGFSNIFYAILNNLGFNISNIDMRPIDAPKKGIIIGHTRNMIYIKDDKYDIHGIYLFDTTWDNKKGDSNEFLNSYRYFAKTSKEFKEFENNHYIYECFLECPNININVLKKDYDMKKDIIKKYENISELSKFIDNKNIIRELKMRQLEVPKIVLERGNSYMFDTIEEYFDRIKELFSLINKPINMKTFIKALYNVRKIEYYEEPNKYPFNLESFRKIALTFPLLKLPTREELLLETIFNDGKNKKAKTFIESSNTFEDYKEESNLETNIERVRFADALRKYKNSRASNLRESFEFSLLDDNIVLNYNSKTKDDIKEMYGVDVSNMIGYEQKNAHHCYDLWNHTLHTVKNIDTSDLILEESKLLKVAAFFHDIGKPNVSKFNEQTHQQVFHGHANESVIVAEPILKAMGYNANEINKILFYIKHHDDFISYKNNLPIYQKNHIFLREITVNSIAEKIIENMYDFKRMGYTEKQIRYICYYLINGKEPRFSRYNEEFVDMYEVIEKIKDGSYNYSYLPSKEDYSCLLELCRADAKSQSDIARIGDNVATKEDKLLVFDKIAYDINEAYNLVNSTVLSIYKSKKETK